MILIPQARIFEIKDTQNDPRKQFVLDVLLGLSKKNKSLSSKYFYDEEGSEIFKKITDLEEYYPTKCEFEILDTYKDRLHQYLSKYSFNFVEFGAGDGRKTKVLLKHFLKRNLDFEYYPLDISASALEGLIDEIRKELPSLRTTGLLGEYFEGIKKLSEFNERRNFVLFLGSNIGNFDPVETDKFMLNLWESLAHGDLALIGFDLVKDEKVLQEAYADSQGITAQFNLNLLTRINRELQADFDLQKFRHYALYDPQSQAMKSYLLSMEDQDIYIKKLRKKFHFDFMEPLFLESSYKYSEKRIQKIADYSNFEIMETFMDKKGYFMNVLLRCVK